jgi:hypothetical protein
MAMDQKQCEIVRETAGVLLDRVQESVERHLVVHGVECLVDDSPGQEVARRVSGLDQSIGVEQEPISVGPTVPGGVVGSPDTQRQTRPRREIGDFPMGNQQRRG